MKAFRAPSITRSLVVALMLLSWFVITNHCALARMLPQKATEGQLPPCHATKPVPGEKAPCKGALQCCQAVKASLSGKAEVKFDTSKFQIQIFAIFQVLAAQIAQPAQELVFDHGPPRAVSFAESVLQRSLLSHAPPFLA